MTCPQIRAQLASYQEGGLRPAQRRVVALHLASCFVCRAELASFEESDRLIRRLVVETPSEAILQGVLQRVAQQDMARRRRKTHVLRSMSGWLNMAGAVGAAGVVGAVLVTLAQGFHAGAWAGQTGSSPAAASHQEMTTESLRLATDARAQTLTLAMQEHAPALSSIRKNPQLYYLHIGDETQFQQDNTQAPIMRAGLLDPEDKALTVVPTPGFYTSISVSPDGQRLAYGVYSPSHKSVWRGIWVRDSLAQTKAISLTVPGDGPDAQIKGVRWSTDGNHLIYSVQTPSTVTGYIATVATRASVKAYDGWWPAFNQAVSPDLRLLAEAGDRVGQTYYGQTITVGALGGGKRWPIAQGVRPVWSPDNRQIAYLAGPISTTLTLWVVGVDGCGKRQLTTTPQKIDEVAWSPDGRSVAYAVDDGGRLSGAKSQLYVVSVEHPERALPGLRTRWIGDMVWVPSPAQVIHR